MNDPHVEHLHYRLVHGDSVTYVDCEPVEHETDAFRLRLANNELTVEMKEHHPTAQAARAVVGPFIRAWEIDVALRRRRGDLAFHFDKAHIIDRDPPPPGSAQRLVGRLISDRMEASDSSTMRVTTTRYPVPPTAFVVSPDVDTLWHRYERYLDGQEPVATMAYFCLTVAESIAGGNRGRAAEKLGISLNLLDKIGKLSNPGRKHTPDEEPVSDAEEAWLDKAVKLLIRRVGEVAADPSAAASKITLRDHPLPRS